MTEQQTIAKLFYFMPLCDHQSKSMKDISFNFEVVTDALALLETNPPTDTMKCKESYVAVPDVWETRRNIISTQGKKGEEVVILLSNRFPFNV